jgi:hypothetical protein
MAKTAMRNMLLVSSGSGRVMVWVCHTNLWKLRVVGYKLCRFDASRILPYLVGPPPHAPQHDCTAISPPRFI